MGGASKVLRADPARLDRQALLSRAAALRGQAGKGYPDGFILALAPPHNTIEELIEQAHDEEQWRAAVEKILQSSN